MSLYSESFRFKQFLKILEQQKVPVAVVDLDGNRYRVGPRKTAITLTIRDKQFFRALASPDAFSLGQAYIKGYFDISGNIRELYFSVSQALLDTDRRLSPARLMKKMVRHLFTRTLDCWKPGILKTVHGEKEKQNIEFHYDVPAAFYRGFLGRTMGYTCGYYPDEMSGLDLAQEAKMEIICRKLGLSAGQRVLELGCGWGNFAVYAARRYGVHVQGITLSAAQKRFADSWIAQEGLKDRVEIQILNYRDLADVRRTGPDGDNRRNRWAKGFDCACCIGMSEHVGKANIPVFYRIVHRCLKPGGLFLQHTITRNQEPRSGYENRFLETYMFPGGQLLAEHELVRLAGEAGFELINTENFRPHYIKTLEDWVSQMEQNRESLLTLVSEQVFRIYHVFFIGALVSFARKELSVFQNLFYRTDPCRTDTRPFVSAYSGTGGGCHE